MSVVSSLAGTRSRSHAMSVSIAGMSLVREDSYCFDQRSTWRPT
jgi:hypothetical protein